MKKILICGTRNLHLDIYAYLVGKELDKIKLSSDVRWTDFEIVEGCCPDSADEYAEIWAEKNKVKVHHFPSTSGNYLKRNIEMVNFADEVMAFWDGFSYGTAHTIAQAIMRKIPVIVIKLEGQNTQVKSVQKTK